MTGLHPHLFWSVGLSRELRGEMARAAKSCSPDAEVVEFESVGHVLAHSTSAQVTLLILDGSVGVEDRALAADALGADGLPRWPVLVLAGGSSSGTVWHVPADRLGESGLAHLLPMIMAHFASVREALRARGDLWTMARRISHEMRSPLGCIITSADVIREEMANAVPAAGAMAQPILDSAREVIELVDRLTLVARASAIPPPFVPVDMNLAVWAACDRLASRIRLSDAVIAEPEVWPSVVGVQDWLVMIWHALLANALQHAGPKPRIEVGWRRVPGGLQFHVEDHGPGVAPEVVPLLFRPFHQLHLGDSGRGLGLAIVQRLVELQGGHCGFEPVQPSGARFHFVLPGTDCAVRPDGRRGSGKAPSPDA